MLQESRVIRWNDMDLTKELHLIRAHLHHYASLLNDFRKSIEFVLATENPALANTELYTEDDRARSREVMERECRQLLSEIERLEQSRVMQDKRVQNVINLVRVHLTKNHPALTFLWDSP
jgi:23S rRNA A2030 N6-methylase RlmJ